MKAEIRTAIGCDGTTWFYTDNGYCMGYRQDNGRVWSMHECRGNMTEDEARQHFEKLAAKLDIEWMEDDEREALMAEKIADWYAKEYPTDYQKDALWSWVTFEEAAREIEATGRLVCERYGEWLDSAVVENIYRETKRRMGAVE